MPFLYVFITVWIWSAIPLAVKVAYASFNFGFIAFCRMASGALVFGLVHWASGRSLRLPADDRRPDLPGPRSVGLVSWIFIAGLAIGGDLLLYTLGLRWTTASAATLIVSTDGVVLALLAAVVLREPMSKLKVAGALSALAGLLLVGWNGQNLSALLGSEYFLGNLAVLGAAFCWATYGLGQRVLASTPGSSLFPIFLVGSGVTGLALLLQSPAHSPVTWPAVLALAFLGLFATGLAYICLAKGMQHLEAATAGLITSTLPVWTMLQAHYLLGEAITPYLLAGATLIISAVLLIVQHQRRHGGMEGTGR
jgi:drug/metabolite transporter (DMT)-like permease